MPVVCVHKMQGDEAITFDSPFASSQLKTALDACMVVWGDCRDAQSHTQELKESATLAEALFGRFAQCATAVNRLSFKQGDMALEDIDYIGSVISKIETAYQALFEYLPADHPEQIKQQLNTVKTKLLSLKRGPQHHD